VGGWRENDLASSGLYMLVLWRIGYIGKSPLMVVLQALLYLRTASVDLRSTHKGVLGR
jgi:hypothetical protein